MGSGNIPKRFNIGMGLAAGSASVVKITQGKSNGSVPVLDYYGYTPNLAAKLQALARPEGLVVAGTYFANQQDWLDFAASLELRKLAMLGDNEFRCYVTAGMPRWTKWTCLAWPGFARTRTAEQSDVKRPPGLNTKGLAVITHEGIYGKIGTLELWPRHDARSLHGDPFEVIIDDFDGLQTLADQGIIRLINRERIKPGNRLTELDIAEAILPWTTDAKFFFVPIRCGLNAYTWHVNASIFAHVKDYANIFEQATQYHTIALYNNAGASMSVLLSGFRREFNAKGIPLPLDEPIRSHRRPFLSSCRKAHGTPTPATLEASSLRYNFTSRL